MFPSCAEWRTIKGFQSQNVPLESSAAAGKRAPSSLRPDCPRAIRHGDNDGALLCTYCYGGGTRRGLDVLGNREEFRAAEGMFLAEMRRTALSHGAALRRDRGFMKRPMAKVPELEGARGYDGEV